MLEVLLATVLLPCAIALIPMLILEGFGRVFE